MLLFVAALPLVAQESFHIPTREIWVVDGDSFFWGKRNLRLHGIDAPELGQTCTKYGHQYSCGKSARRYLINLLKSSKTLVCHEIERDKWQRIIVKCFMDEEDVAHLIVRQGWAIAYRYYSFDYMSDEDIARRYKRGIWAGKFTYPARWRRQKSSK